MRSGEGAAAAGKLLLGGAKEQAENIVHLQPALAARMTMALEWNGQVHISTGACTSERLSQRWLGPGPELKGLVPLWCGEEEGAVGLGQAGAWLSKHSLLGRQPSPP